MQAVICRHYGSPELVLRCEDVATPTPGDDEVLIKVRAAAVNPLDSHLMKGKPYAARLVFGLTGPTVTCPGRDVAGQVEAVGRNVRQFQPGDEVFGGCRGAFAEYACASEAELAPKPAGITFEQAAAVPIAGITALQCLRDKGRLQPGQRVLVNGAAGGVGHVRGADRQGDRGARDRRLQHEERGTGAFARAPTASSTTPGRTSPGRRSLRRDARLHLQPLAVG